MKWNKTLAYFVRKFNSDGSSEVEILKEQLDHSSSLNRSLGLIFATLLMYVGITFITISDFMLLKGDALVLLPVLNIDIPLVPFFWVTPMILLGFHINVLLNLLEHSKKLYRWVNEDKTKSELRLTKGRPFLFNFIILHRDNPKGNRIPFAMTVFLVNLVAFYAPLVMLLIFQVRFSDYHDLWATRWHFTIVFLDALVLILLRPRIMNRKNYEKGKANYWFNTRVAAQWILFLVTGATFFYSLLNIFILEEIMAYKTAPWVHKIMKEEDCQSYKNFGSLMVSWDWVYKPRLNVDEPNLVKSGSETAYVMAMMNNPETQLRLARDSATYQFGEGMNLRGRDLSYAHLHGALMDHCDLRNASLKKAKLCESSLRKANLKDCNLNGADLKLSNLTHCNLEKASLKDSSVLNNCCLHGANLENVEANGAQFKRVDFSGAVLKYGTFNNASFSEAEFIGVVMNDASFIDADFSECEIIGSYLLRDSLVGAEFSYTTVYGCEFQKVVFYNADLSHANIVCSDFSDVDMSLIKMVGGGFQGCRLLRSSFNAAYMDGVGLQNSDLSGVQLTTSIIISPKTQGARLKVNSRSLALVLNSDFESQWDQLESIRPIWKEQCPKKWFIDEDAFEKYRMRVANLETLSSVSYTSEAPVANSIGNGFLEFRKNMLMGFSNVPLDKFLLPAYDYYEDQTEIVRHNDLLCQYAREHSKERWKDFLRLCYADSNQLIRYPMSGTTLNHMTLHGKNSDE